MNARKTISSAWIYVSTHTHIGLLLAIFVIAVLLRTINLSSTPNGFHVDELDAGYIGRYILTHGKDVLGNPLPFVYNRFGDYRATGIFYLSGLSALIFGSSVFAVRLPAAIFGAATVAALYLIAVELFRNKRIALFSALSLAVLPWHITLSRATSEAVVGLFFATLGLGLFLRGIRTNTMRVLWFGAISLGMSYLFYHSFRLLVPLFLLPIIWKPVPNKHMHKIIRMSVILFVTLSAIVSFTLSGNGRLNQVIFYKNPTLVSYIQSLNNADGPTAITQARIFHNKAIVYTTTLVREYFKYFSTEFLAIKGGLPARYVVPEQGLIYLSFFVFLLGGLAVLSSRRNKWLLCYMVFLFIIAPLPAAITFEDTPNVHRAIFMILPIVLFVGLGIFSLLEIFQKSRRLHIMALICIIAIISAETIYFGHLYAIHSKSYQGVSRNDGFTELIKYTLAHKNKYKNVYIPVYDDMPLYFRFFTSDYSPYTHTNLPNDTEIQTIGNVTFVPSWCSSIYVRRTEQLDHSILTADREECEGFANLAIIYTIKRKDNTKAFMLNEYYGEPNRK